MSKFDETDFKILVFGAGGTAGWHESIAGVAEDGEPGRGRRYQDRAALVDRYVVGLRFMVCVLTMISRVSVSSV